MLVIPVNDRSTDETHAIIDEFVGADSPGAFSPSIALPEKAAKQRR